MQIVRVFFSMKISLQVSPPSENERCLLGIFAHWFCLQRVLLDSAELQDVMCNKDTVAALYDANTGPLNNSVSFMSSS